MDLLLIPLYAFIDRIRGDNRGFGGYGEMVIGGAVLYWLLVHEFGWWMLAFAVLWSLGSTWGWGNPIGAAMNRTPMGDGFEWWQKWLLRKYTYLALFFRGAMWGFPVMCLFYWIPEVWKPALAILIAFPLSCFLASFVDRDKFNLTWLADRHPSLKGWLLTKDFHRGGWRLSWCAKRWHLMEWIRGSITVTIMMAL